MSVTESTPAANDADTKAASRSVDVAMRNATSLTLEIQDTVLARGAWRPGPPLKIEPFSSARFRAESSGFATGVQGWVSYATSAGRDKGPLSISFDNPFLGEDQFAAIPPTGYETIYTPPEGNNPVVKLTLTTDLSH